MKYGLSDTTIAKIIDIFKSDPNVHEAIIYGSRAIGNYREGSDIDITLKGELTFNNILRLEGKLDNQMLPYRIDLSSFEKIKNRDLIEHINRVGKVLYRKHG
jgi:predicted nucleotidyltransferase